MHGQYYMYNVHNNYLLLQQNKYLATDALCYNKLNIAYIITFYLFSGLYRYYVNLHEWGTLFEDFPKGKIRNNNSELLAMFFKKLKEIIFKELRLNSNIYSHFELIFFKNFEEGDR